MNWPATGCGEKGLFLWPPALAGAQRASCLSAAHGVGIRLPGSCFRPSRSLQFRSQSRKLRDSSGIACLSLPRFRQGLLLSGAHGCESHRATQGPSLLHRAPCASPSQCRDVAAPGRAQFPGTHTACRQQWPGSVFLPRRNTTYFSPHSPPALCTNGPAISTAQPSGD